MTTQQLTDTASGSGEIRTHGTLSRTHTFQTRARNHGRAPRRANAPSNVDALRSGAGESGFDDPDGVPSAYQSRSVYRGTWAILLARRRTLARHRRTTRLGRAVARPAYKVIVRGTAALRPIIYGLVDPSEPARVRYVGQTTQSPQTRYLGHLGGCERPTPRSKWIAALLEAGRLPHMVLLETVPTASDLNARERWWILSLEERGGADLNGWLPRARA
jgi:hypothetical protein